MNDDCHFLTDDIHLHHQNYYLNILIDNKFNQ